MQIFISADWQLSVSFLGPCCPAPLYCIAVHNCLMLTEQINDDDDYVRLLTFDSPFTQESVNMSGKDDKEIFLGYCQCLCSSLVLFTARCYAKRGICRRRVSVTLRYCIKTAKHRIMQIMPHDRSGTLVFK